MKNLFDLTGKVAIVTGSTKGIGKASAEALAEHGAKVAISSRNQGDCDTVAAEINAVFGDGTAIGVAAGLSSKEALQALVDATRAAFGRIDVLVCNAASNPYYGPMGGIDDAQLRKVLDNNIVANHWLIQMVAPEMVERGAKDGDGGSIILVSSIAGIRGTPAIGAYGISKAADMALARNLAHEFGPHGVRVNAIAPGLVQTDFARALWEDPERAKETNARVPLRRIGQPDEIAGAVVYLAARASAFMTGHAMVIDGGVTI